MILVHALTALLLSLPSRDFDADAFEIPLLDLSETGNDRK